MFYKSSSKLSIKLFSHKIGLRSMDLEAHQWYSNNFTLSTIFWIHELRFSDGNIYIFCIYLVLFQVPTDLHGNMSDILILWKNQDYWYLFWERERKKLINLKKICKTRFKSWSERYVMAWFSVVSRQSVLFVEETRSTRRKWLTWHKSSTNYHIKWESNSNF